MSRRHSNRSEERRFFSVTDHGDITVLRLGLHMPEQLTDLQETEHLWQFLAGHHRGPKKVLLIINAKDTLSPASLDEFWAHVHKNQPKLGSVATQMGADRVIAREENAARHFVELMRRTDSLVISAVQGDCDFSFLGGILASDYRIASQDAAFVNRLYLSETTVGLLPWFLSRFLGHAEAADILLEGRSLTASEAYELKLVNKLAPIGRFEQLAMDTAKRFAAIPTPALRALKRGLVASVEGLDGYLSQIGTGFQHVMGPPRSDAW